MTPPSVGTLMRGEFDVELENRFPLSLNSVFLKSSVVRTDEIEAVGSCEVNSCHPVMSGIFVVCVGRDELGAAGVEDQDQKEPISGSSEGNSCHPVISGVVVDCIQLLSDEEDASILVGRRSLGVLSDVEDSTQLNGFVVDDSDVFILPVESREMWGESVE